MLDLSRLTDQQRRIVLAKDGPLLVQAGPGTGKTTLLAARIAFLVAVRGLDPAGILALSFTRVAASQLRDRLRGLLGDQAKDVAVVTCHALGLRIVRQWQEELGFGSQPLTVLTQYEARQGLKAAAEQCQVDLKRLPLEQLAEEVDEFRMNGCCSLELGVARSVAAAYERLLRRRGAVDFAGMLALPLRLFGDAPRAIQLYRDVFRNLFADELQDISPAQYEMLRQLSLRHRNLVAVGDLAQTLYAHRGAGTAIFQRFQQDFPDARLATLNQNFRSTASIVEVANRLGESLSCAQPLHTENDRGPAPSIYEAADERAEATFVAGELLRLLDRGLLASLAEAAVLYRTNAQSGELILALREAGIAYRVAGDAELFASREVQYALAYLRLAVNPADGVALARIVNVPPRRLARLARRAAMEPCATSELARLARPYGAAVLTAAESLARLILDVADRSAALRAPEVLDLILDQTGLAEWLGSQPDVPASVKRLEALRGLLEQATDGLADWLDDLALGPGFEAPAPQADAVVLSSIHRAKGMEWPVVFAVGLEEGLLPHAHALDTGQAGPEDELRVAYVAMTRARERLYLTYCRSRRRGGITELREPSRFLTAVEAVPRQRAS